MEGRGVPSIRSTTAEGTRGCRVREGEARGNPDRHPGSPREAEGGERGWERDPGERWRPFPQGHEKRGSALLRTAPLVLKSGGYLLSHSYAVPSA